MAAVDAARVASIARKEVRHILRDPFTLAFALGIPVILLTFFGFVIDLNVKDVRLSVRDSDKTRISRQLAEVFAGSAYFRLLPPMFFGDSVRELDTGKASGVLIIHPEFGKRLASGKEARAQLLVDGADNSKAAVVLGYLAGIRQASINKLSPFPMPEPIEVRTRFLFNPELNSQWFVVPGLCTIVIGLISILLTALTVAREWENGSMEKLLATPVRPLEIIIGKLAPYTVLGLAGVVLVYLTARLVFSVPFAGNHLFFAAACLIYILAALSQGLLISVLVRQQQIAMQLSLITGLLPSLLLSGFIFPIESMPAFFRYLTMIFSQRWFMTVSRGIFLRGSDLRELLTPLSALALICAIMLFLASKKFKTDLEP
jgi:ABC-2 type transport system permease protein